MTYNRFLSTKRERRLLCVSCRHRLGVGNWCVETYAPVMGNRRKPAVWHQECYFAYAYDNAKRFDLITHDARAFNGVSDGALP